MKQIVILANSVQERARCLAGIDLDNKQWVRPVHETNHVIPTSRAICTVSKNKLSIGDVLECELSQPDTFTEYQCENQVVRNWNWKVNGHYAPNDLIQFVDDTSPILHSPDNRVEASLLKDKDPSEWKSLQLVKPKEVESYKRNVTYHGQNPRMIRFRDAKKCVYELTVTDPLARDYYRSNDNSNINCLLTVSLVSPFPPKRQVCYKVVAAVIEIPQ